MVLGQLPKQNPLVGVFETQKNETLKDSQVAAELRLQQEAIFQLQDALDKIRESVRMLEDRLALYLSERVECKDSGTINEKNPQKIQCAVATDIANKTNTIHALFDFATNIQAHILTLTNRFEG